MKELQTIAIQGEQASFHHIAARQYYHRGIEVAECRTFRQVCEMVREGRAASGMMAIENSLAGSILPNYNLLESQSLYIRGEVYVCIQQCLMALPGQSLNDMGAIRSHPMAIHQCSEFLEQHPYMRAIETFDTAGSAREIRQQELLGVAAIASEEAARLYQLTILARNIENQRQNYTRFLIISTQPPAFSDDANKASLSFRIGHRPGALVEVLEVFRRCRINLTLIQSVPIPGRPSEYAFHVDITWQRGQAIEKALEQVEAVSNGRRILGIYRAGELPYDHSGSESLK